MLSTKEFPWIEVRLVGRADNSAVIIVPNVELRIEVQHSIPHLSLLHLLQESFTSLHSTEYVM
jgi:hypothetical protein